MSNRITPQEWGQLFGIAWSDSDPLIPMYEKAQAASAPNPMHGFSIGNTDSGYTGGAASWPGLCLLMLQARQLLYCQRKPGDCANVKPSSNYNLGSGLGTEGVGVLNAFAQAGATGGLNVIADISATFDTIGLLVGILSGADQDILNERKVLCPLTIQVNQIYAQTDQQVASGQLDMATALNNLANLTAQISATIQRTIGLSKSGGANTGGCFAAFAKAQYTFRVMWYPTISQGIGSVGKIAAYGAAAFGAVKFLGV